MTEIEKKLAEAEKAVSEIRQELTKTEAALAGLDVTAGDVDDVVNSKLRIQTKRDVLQKRLAIATEAAEELRADMLLDRAADMREQVKANNAALDKARQTARADFQKLIIGGVLEACHAARLTAIVELHKAVAPLLEKKEFLSARLQEAERAAAGMKQRRAIAESGAREKLQREIFDTVNQ